MINEKKKYRKKYTKIKNVQKKQNLKKIVFTEENIIVSSIKYVI